MRKQNIRNQILDGRLTMPKIPALADYDEQTRLSIDEMFQAAFNAYLRVGERDGKKPTINMPYWAKRVADIKALNVALITLSKSGWFPVSTRPNNNWSEAYMNELKLLEYVTADELLQVRKYKKYQQYT